MSSIAGPSVEDLTREYHAKIAQAALHQYRNEDLLRDWWDHVEGSLAPTTRKDWRRFSGRLLAWLTKTRGHLLKTGHKEANAFRAWVEEAKYEDKRGTTPPRPAVVLNHICVAGLIFDYLRDIRGLVLVNPFPDVYRVYKKHHRSELHPDLRAFDEDEAAQVLEGADTLEDFTMNLTLAKTGIRREEYVRIQESHIDWRNQLINIQPHPKRTYLQAYFDDELEYFLRLKVEQNHRLYPGNRYLSPSPLKRGAPINACTVTYTVKKVAKNSPVGVLITDWKDPQQNVTAHTWRRTFTSILKRNGCPDHITAVLRGDSLLHESELVKEPTQGYYTKFAKKGGKPELRYWYEKCAPKLRARETWERLTPRAVDAQSMKELARALSAGR